MYIYMYMHFQIHIVYVRTPKNVSHCDVLSYSAMHGVAGYRLCMYTFHPHTYIWSVITYRTALW